MPVVSHMIAGWNEAEGKSRQVRTLRNWYVEPNSGGIEYPASWMPTPGTKTWKDTGLGEVRGLYEKDDVLYVIADDKMYTCDDAGNLTERGTLLTKRGVISWAEGVDEMLFVDGESAYSYQIADADFAEITDPQFPKGSISVTFQDGYFVAAHPDSLRFYISNIDDGRTWDDLDFGAKSVYGDCLRAVKSYKSYLWIMGLKNTEVWGITSGTGIPFIRQSGLLLDLGTPAPQSLHVAGDSLFWLARHADGGYVFVKATEFAPKIISNFGIGKKLNQLTSVDDCYTWSYTQYGHEFVIFNFPSDKISFAYDHLTNQWHEFSYRTNSQIDEHHIGQCYAFFNGKHLVGSRINGKILQLDKETFTDNDGDIIRRVAQIGPFEFDTRKMTASNLEILTEPGIGDGTTSSQGIDPMLMLRVSRDYGYTWGNPVLRSPGKQGEYRDRILWKRVGTGRNLSLEIAATDPVNWIIKGVRVNTKIGNS